METEMALSLLLYVLVGFVAQMIDGALGMAYGVSSNTFLLSLGIPPAAASASVHMAEVVTTGVSGASHWKLGNVDWKLVRRLLIPGVIGGAIGAYLLTSIDGNIIKPYIAIYLLIMGGVIVYKAFTLKPRNKPDGYHGPRISLLGLFGGFCDADSAFGGMSANQEGASLWENCDCEFQKGRRASNGRYGRWRDSRLYAGSKPCLSPDIFRKNCGLVGS